MSEFAKLEKALEAKFKAITKDVTVLFKTKASKDDLWETYIESFPEGTNEIYKERREYDCNCCKSFVRHYGNVVAIIDNKMISIWDVPNAPAPFGVVFEKLSALVKSEPIDNQFFSKEKHLGTKVSRFTTEDGAVGSWEHLYLNLPAKFVRRASMEVGAEQGKVRANKEVFKRSLDELTLESAEIILDLIAQGSLYRGDQHKEALLQFVKAKKAYNDIDESEKDNWCWLNSASSPVARIRNTAIGTMLIDLSEGIDLETSVRKFHAVMAPTNYKRPKALITKKMIGDAEKKIKELGLQDSLGRRHAVLEDITVNNVLFVNRDAKAKLGGSVFDDLKEDVPVNLKSFDKVEEVSIDDFIKDILPNSSNIELMIENRHKGNLMSLIAPEDSASPSIMKWDNNFSWSYNGGIADSMKMNVAKAGGKIDGVLRFSIQWNDGDNNQNDFDAHCVEPRGNEIYFSQKNNLKTTGQLDVDITQPGAKVAVENITWTELDRMEEGVYHFFVNNYSHNGGRTGFTAEIEYDGQVHSYAYDAELKSKEKVTVAKLKFSKANGIEFVESLPSSVSSQTVWGIDTHKFTKVEVAMLSPNYWDGQKSGESKRYFFFLEGCKAEVSPRGFYNEFLNEGLTPHRKVFEALGSKMKVAESDQQLSGLGFSATQRNDVIAKVDGAFSRTIKIKF